MEMLKELVMVINHYSKQNFEVITNAKTGSTKYAKLYRAILNGQVNNDQEAVQYLYNTKEVNASYKKFKNRFYERLLNTVFMIDVSDAASSDTFNKYMKSIRLSAAISILIVRGAKKSSFHLMKKVLKYALSAENYYVAFNMAKLLRNQYALQEKGYLQYVKHRDLADRCLDYLSKEHLAEKYYYEIGNQVSHSGVIQQSVIDLAGKYSTELKSYLDEVRTNRYVVYTFSIETIYHELLIQPEEVIHSCRAALEILNSKSNVLKANTMTFQTKMTMAYFKLREFEEANFHAEQLVKENVPGYLNWFIHQSYLMLVKFHQKSYTEAASLFFTVSKHRQLKFQRNQVIESWKLYEGYIYWLLKIGKIDKNQLAPEDAKRRFRLKKFINDVPEFSKDKKGSNIAILILHILILIQQKDFDTVENRLASLAKYANHHLRQPETYRSYYFIKMMLQLPYGKFDSRIVPTKAKKWENKLNRFPFERAVQMNELEILPYETIWSYVLEMI